MDDDRRRRRLRLFGSSGLNSVMVDCFHSKLTYRVTRGVADRCQHIDEMVMILVSAIKRLVDPCSARSP